MHLSSPIFHDVQLSQKRQDRPKFEESYVSDEGGSFILTRGAVPNTVHGNYSKLPTTADWTSAEIRHRELTKQLEQLEGTIKQKEENIKSKTSSTGNIDSMKMSTLGIKSGSAVWGSAFNWQGVGNKSTVHADFDWPVETLPRHTVENPKYGMLTKINDIPLANTHKNPQARGRGLRAQTASASIR